MGMAGLSKLGNFVWGIADQLRGVYKPHQYGGVILPFTILRRLDCVLAPSRAQVRELAAQYSDGALDVQVKRKTGLGFYNTSAFDIDLLLKDPEGLRANLVLDLPSESPFRQNDLIFVQPTLPRFEPRYQRPDAKTLGMTGQFSASAHAWPSNGVASCDEPPWPLARFL